MYPPPQFTIAISLLMAISVPIAMCVRKGRVRVNHVALFSGGYAFYWLLPPLLSETTWFQPQEPGLVFWRRFVFARSTEDGVAQFLAVGTIAYAAFAIGSWLGRRRIMTRPEGARNALPMRGPLQSLVLLIGLLFAAYSFRIRGALFTGYVNLSASSLNQRGTLTAVGLLLVVACFFEVIRAIRSGELPSTIVRSPVVMAGAASQLIVLSLGGRLYVVTAILSLIVLYACEVSPVRISTLAGTGVLLVALAGLYGVLRLGGGISLQGIVSNIAAEPLFTSLSLYNFIGRVHVPAIMFPKYLLSDLVNIIPTALLPAKANLLANPETAGFPIFAPLGAQHAYLSWAINFGYIGMIVCWGLIGYWLSVLESNAHPAKRLIYSLCSGWCAFSLFRDPFSVSLVKNVLEFSIIVPLAMWWLLNHWPQVRSYPTATG